MRFLPEPVPISFIDPELSRTSATSSVFFSRISDVAEKFDVGRSALPADQLGEGREEDRACT